MPDERYVIDVLVYDCLKGLDGKAGPEHTGRTDPISHQNPAEV